MRLVLLSHHSPLKFIVSMVYFIFVLADIVRELKYSLNLPMSAHPKENQILVENVFKKFNTI